MTLIVCAVILVLLLAAAAGLFVVYHIVFFSPHRNADEIDVEPFLDDDELFSEIKCQARKLAQIPCERVSTRSCDGLRLSARYYRRSDNAPLCICFHGYRGSAVFDFSVMGQFLQNEGYNVIIPDERAHFASGGHTITFGIRERRDVLSWIEYANSRFGSDTPIYLFGISMGAATVVMASGLDLPDNVRLILADCPYSSPSDIIRDVARKSGYPRFIWQLIRLSALVYGRLIIPGDLTAANAAKLSEKPILLIHGEADKFVPAHMSEEIRLAHPKPIARHTFPGADHGVSYFSDPERYVKILRSFIARHSK